ncbi:MAG: UDP-N-acetylmuramoyl-L-alanine--D-glutamate ligase [candidate division Zixibacteria bacterium]|nr:UDP-N-acetylmuramoyl-L-alanine--D-glutamate ligase [candidate division Zixibacteria bacterium]
MDFSDQKISVIGAARSGLAAAVVLKNLGAEPFLSEHGPESKYTEAKETLTKYDIRYEFGGHSDRVYDCRLMVTSPGVPADTEILTTAVSKNIKVISELELGFQLCGGKVLAVTGSNGKTTTTSLIGEIFSHSRLNSLVAGNIGNPFCAVARGIGIDDWAILEVSTFQLEWIDKFKPRVAVVLNITPDHLDRHGNMENYIALKLKIFSNQNGTDNAILNADDENLKAFDSISGKHEFSTAGEVDNGCFARDNTLYLCRKGNIQRVIDISEITIKGPHNLANACAAVACCAAAGIDIESINAGLKSFQGVEHRLEQVGLIGGVSFINDSKATNVDAVYWALQSVFSPVVLIAGGRDKDGDFSTLTELVREKVSNLVLIGEAADKIESVFKDVTRVIRADSLEGAVGIAYEKAGPDGVVLLSPACASFDMFDDFEHRGEAFKQAFNMLKEVSE